MGSAAWSGEELKAIGEQHGWNDAGPGGKHPIRMQKAGYRTVPIRKKIQNREEAKGILKQMDIPKKDWPENLQR
jgi:hypothetical protein